jgi:K+-sensing histidine kinase KdpD
LRDLRRVGDAAGKATSAGMSSNAEIEPAGAFKSFRRRWMTPITVSLALVALTTAALWPVQAQLNQEHLIFIYLVPTSLIAIRFGSVSAMCVAIASSMAAAYFFYAPRFSFAVANPLDLLELMLFCLLALLASQVVSGFDSDGEVVKRRRRGTVPLSRRWPLLVALRDRVRLH